MAEQYTKREYWDPHHNEICAGGVTVAEYQTEEECNFAAYLLSERGIRSGILLPERRLDLRWPQIRVSHDDELEARRILTQFATAEKKAEYDAEQGTAPFVIPHCPKCESCEIVLDGVGSGNIWRCEHCGASWTETLDAPESGSEWRG